MNNEKLNGLFEIIELILNKEPSIVDSFLFDSLGSYIYIVFPKINDKVDSLVEDIADICEDISSGDDCRNEKEELRKIYNEIKKELENSVTIRDNKSTYTKKTYFYYNDAVIFAKSTLENPSSSIEELKSAYNKLIASKNNLVKLSPNINEEKQDEIKNLEKAIEECKLTKKGAEVYSRKCAIYF